MNERVRSASVAFTDAMALGSWERCSAILTEAISACESARELAALFHAGGIDEVIFSEAPLDGVMADAIVERATFFAGADGANALGWLGALSTFVPTSLFSLDSVWDVRRVLRSAVERHIDLLRTWLRDRSAKRRVAAAFVLAHCTNTTEADVRMLVDVATRERDTEALATQLLALGVLHHRTKVEPDAVRALATRHVASESALVKLCAATALAFLGDVLAKDATLSIVRHVTEPVPLPKAWAAGDASSQVAASTVLLWMKTSAIEEAIDVLVSVPSSLPRIARNAVAGVLFTLAFDARGASVPDVGVAMSDLDAVQRKAVETIARLEASIGALQFRLASDVVAFVSGGTLHFRPLAIVSGRERRWHYARILGAVAVGEVTLDVARDAVLRLPDAEAADLASRWSSGRVFLDVRIKDAAGRDRMLALCLAILSSLRQRGFDVDSLARASVGDRSRSSPDVGILAIASLRAHAEDVPDDLIPLISRAVAQGWWKEQLLAEISTLPERSRAKVVAAIAPQK